MFFGWGPRTGFTSDNTGTHPLTTASNPEPALYVAFRGQHWLKVLPLYHGLGGFYGLRDIGHVWSIHPHVFGWGRLYVTCGWSQEFALLCDVTFGL